MTLNCALWLQALGCRDVCSHKNWMIFGTKCCFFLSFLKVTLYATLVWQTMVTGGQARGTEYISDRPLHICTVACRRGGGASTSTYTYLRMSTCRHRRGCEAGRGWARWHLINCRCWPRYWVRGHAVPSPAATCTNWHWNTFYAANCRILLIAWIVKLENLPLKACLLSSSGICIVSIFNSFQMHLSVLLSI